MGSAITIMVRDFEDRVVFDTVALVDRIEVFVVRMTSEEFNQEDIIL